MIKMIDFKIGKSFWIIRTTQSDHGEALEAEDVLQLEAKRDKSRRGKPLLCHLLDLP